MSRARWTRTQIRRAAWITLVVLLLCGVVLGTKVVANDDPLAQGVVEFDAAVFGDENFPVVRDEIAGRAVDGPVLAAAIDADPDAAVEEYATLTSGVPVFSVVVTGVVGEGQSGIYALEVEGMPDDVQVRVQTGPAINGTDLRDATGQISFGQFTNQIDFQNAAAALNDELKKEVLADIDASALSGRTITLVGAFTLINPASWLVTPVELTVR